MDMEETGRDAMEELVTVGVLGLGALIITTAIILLSARVETRQVMALEVAAEEDQHRR